MHFGHEDRLHINVQVHLLSTFGLGEIKYLHCYQFKLATKYQQLVAT